MPRPRLRFCLGLRETAENVFFADLMNGSVFHASGPDEALCTAGQLLQKTGIDGITLDVFCDESPAKDHPRCGLDNVILIPHITAFAADFAKNFRQNAGRRNDDLKNV